MTNAVLSLLLAPGVNPPTAPWSSAANAIVLALGVTALVSLGMMTIALRKKRLLTAFRGTLSVAAALGTAGFTLVGFLALSPSPAGADVLDGTSHGGSGMLELETVSGPQLLTLSQ